MTKEKVELKRKLVKKTGQNLPVKIIIGLALLVLILVGLYQVPSIQNRAYYHLARARARLFYFFNPPAAVAFSPVEQGAMISAAQSTLTARAPTQTPTPTAQPTEMDTPTPTITATPTITPTRIPMAVQLKGVKLEAQGFNNCGPTNMAMILSYWGWKGDQHVTEKVLKPRKEDRNVMPYEMLDYVQTQTDLDGIVRYGGNIDLVKRLVAAGFPVVIERGYMDKHEGWMGHYGIITGYDDAKQQVSIPDSYIGEIKMSYADIEMYWAHFDDIYLVVFPHERAQEVYDILGPQMDDTYNKQYALDQVTNRLYTLEGRELFFAWYSRGSILVEMNDYYGASQSFDKAFEIYATLKEEERPWRITWYQTGPFFAYYYMGRYNDLYNLAKQTLDKTPEDAIPETWVWLGRAAVMLGKHDEAVYDFRQALFWHPDWWVAKNELIALGEPVD